MKGKIERLLAFHCSPALLGIKPSNLINISLKDFPNIEDIVKELNNTISYKVCLEILNITESRALVLVYQPSKLAKTIFKPENHQFLKSFDYPTNKNLSDYLDILKERIDNNGDFPHEIGVFLGYALDDIMEYQKGNRNCLYVGYWKVFSNKEDKIKIFNQYTRCKNIVSRLLDKGYTLESII